MAISQQSRTSEPPFQTPRSFIKPPADLQAIVEAVAEIVAIHGPTAEFRLRSGSEGRSQYPFLYLDDQYAPFYQCKLSEARARRSVVTAIPAGPSGQVDICSGDEAQGNIKTNTAKQTMDGCFPNCDDLNEVSNYTYGNSNDNHHPPRQLLPTLNDHNSYTSLAANIETNPSLTNPVNDDDALKIGSGRNKPSLSVDIQPYGILQEVHMLDSLGTELSGLNTYVIISNSRAEIDGSLETEFLRSTDQVKDIDPIYRLRPDVSAVFRARHDRLLPVGLPLGAEVQLPDKTTSGVVVRRTVQERQRHYDVKDEHGAIHKDLAEEHLQLHEGGAFEFRLPNQI